MNKSMLFDAENGAGASERPCLTFFWRVTGEKRVFAIHSSWFGIL